MTYSRQQRERAVDLYIKYEHSAADVIHELGYPSRTILYVWYRERLEEERAGVPSGRGQRHRRYSDGQKQAAVDHCLEYGRRPGRTMRMPGYPKSKELLYFVKSVFRVGAGAVLLDSSLIPSPPIMPQDRARVDDP